MFDQAAKTESDVVERYVILQAALKLRLPPAMRGSAFETIDATAAGYQVDSLALKTDSLLRILKSPADASKRKSQLEQVLALVDAAVNADAYGAAKQVLTVAIPAARSARDPDVPGNCCLGPGTSATKRRPTSVALRRRLETLDTSDRSGRQRRSG